LEVRVTCRSTGETRLRLASSADDLEEDQVFITADGGYDPHGAELVHARVTCGGE
jgi:hypothetical protein